MKRVSVVLNGFRRPWSMQEQISAVRNQSEPCEIYVWQNKADYPDFAPLDAAAVVGTFAAVSNHNFGVWARFAYALNCRTEFVCVMDDDTIPGTHWIENCINNINEKEGIYGTVGVIFDDLSYWNFSREGWPSLNEQRTRTDIVGHSWFFRREWLGYYWLEWDHPFHNLSGEDIHFSYIAQKYLNIGSYVPPHPPDNPSLWGSFPKTAYQYGCGAEAISAHAGWQEMFSRNLHHYHEKGFKFLKF